MSSEAWSACAAGISAAAAIVAVVAAWRIAKAQQKTARQQLRATAWSMIAQFDDTLRMYDAERKWVKEQARKSDEDQQKTDSDQLDIAGYMGIFERLNELLGTGPDFVSEKTAHAFYGSRLRLLLKTTRVRNILEKRPAGWVLFISLSLKLDDYGRQNQKSRVIAFPGSDPESGPKPDEDYRRKLEALLRDLADARNRRAEPLADHGSDDGLRARVAADNQEAASRPA